MAKPVTCGVDQHLLDKNTQNRVTGRKKNDAYTPPWQRPTWTRAWTRLEDDVLNYRRQSSALMWVSSGLTERPAASDRSSAPRGLTDRAAR